MHRHGRTFAMVMALPVGKRTSIVVPTPERARLVREMAAKYRPDADVVVSTADEVQQRSPVVCMPLMKAFDEAVARGAFFLVLSPAQIGHWDFVCSLKSCFPGASFVAQRPLVPLAIDVGQQPGYVVGLSRKQHAQLVRPKHVPQKRPSRYIPRDRNAWWQR